MVVMGPFYKDVDHVEYQAVGAAGQKRSVSMEEGMRWEGLASAQNDDEVGWFALSLSLSLSLAFPLDPCMAVFGVACTIHHARTHLLAATSASNSAGLTRERSSSVLL